MAPTPNGGLSWPPDDPGKVLLHLEVGASVDQVFADIFGPKSELQAKFREQRQDTNISESPWVERRDDLPKEQFAWSTPAGTALGAAGAGKMRKVRFDAATSPLTKAFSSEEIQKVLAFHPGSHYAIETDVFTNAMYGDKFLVISRYTLVARGPSKCVLHLVYAAAFSSALSRMLRPVVAKGIESGIRGSFQVFHKLLAERYQVTDLPEQSIPPAVEGAPAPTEVVAPRPPAAAAAAPTAVPVAVTLADYIIYNDLAARLLRMNDPRAAARALAAVLTLSLVHLLTTALRPLQSACLAVGDASAAAAASAEGGEASGWLSVWGGRAAAAACWPVSAGWVRLPEGLPQVLGALALVAVANWLLIIGAELVDGYLRRASLKATLAATRRAQAAAAASAAAAAARAKYEEAAAAAAAAAAALSVRPLPPAPGSNPDLKELEREAREAHSAALRASRSFTARAGSSGAPVGADAAMPHSRSAVALAGSPSQLAAAAAAAAVVAASGGPSGGSAEGAAMKQMGVGIRKVSLLDTVTQSSEGLRNLVSGALGHHRSRPASPAPATGPGVAGPSHRPSPSFSTTLDPSGYNIIENYAQAPSGAAAAASAAEAPRSAPAPIPGADGAGGGSRASSPARSPRASNGSGITFPGFSSVPASLDWLRGTPLAPGVAALDTLTTISAGLINAGAGMFAWPEPDPNAIPDGEEPEDEAVSEVYEHERVQPFRGWGHDWPGHFLPSDRVGHWGDRYGRPGGPMSMLFERVVPRLPVGWEWTDAEWRVDMSGLAEERVDAEGWAYSIDFSFFTWPPEEGQGKANLRTFVRRRRWVRARVRTKPAAETAMAEAALAAATGGVPPGAEAAEGEEARARATASVDGGVDAPHRRSSLETRSVPLLPSQRLKEEEEEEEEEEEKAGEEEGAQAAGQKADDGKEQQDEEGEEEQKEAPAAAAPSGASEGAQAASSTRSGGSDGAAAAEEEEEREEGAAAGETRSSGSDGSRDGDASPKKAPAAPTPTPTTPNGDAPRARPSPGAAAAATTTAGAPAPGTPAAEQPASPIARPPAIRTPASGGAARSADASTPSGGVGGRSSAARSSSPGSGPIMLGVMSPDASTPGSVSSLPFGQPPSSGGGAARRSSTGATGAGSSERRRPRVSPGDAVAAAAAAAADGAAAKSLDEAALSGATERRSQLAGGDDGTAAASGAAGDSSAEASRLGKRASAPDGSQLGRQGSQALSPSHLDEWSTGW